MLCLALITGLVLLVEHSNACRNRRSEMKQNMGGVDKVIRLVVVAIIATLYSPARSPGRQRSFWASSRWHSGDEPHRLVSDLRAVRHFQEEGG